MRDARVLDIGCGFGLRLICFALLGAKTYVGIDISPMMIGDFKKLSDRFALDVQPICGDFLDFELPEESFDIVLMNDSISHVRDTYSLLVKIRRILTPDGCLWITDDNNSLFLPSKMRGRRVWKQYEYGPIDVTNATIGRETDRLPYYEARTNIIQNRYPYLDEKVVRQLAKDTRGMFGKQIIHAVKEYMKDGKKPEKPSFQYRNPYTGEYPELLFNPKKLVRDIRKIGFECRLMPPSIYNGRPVRPITARQPSIVQSVLTTCRRLARGSSTIAPFLYHGFTIFAKKLS
jgi:SAM-dependent methyltransferase